MAYNYHRRHQKAMAEAAASNSDPESGSSQANTSTSNHCEEWNPNQIVYNKVCSHSFGISLILNQLSCCQ